MEGPCTLGRSVSSNGPLALLLPVRASGLHRHLGRIEARAPKVSTHVNLEFIGPRVVFGCGLNEGGGWKAKGGAMPP